MQRIGNGIERGDLVRRRDAHADEEFFEEARPLGEFGNVSQRNAGTGDAGFSGDNGPAISARLFNPQSLTVDGSGNIYFADTRNHRVRRIDATTGVITTIAGNGRQESSGDGGPALAAGIMPSLIQSLFPGEEFTECGVPVVLPSQTWPNP